MTYAKLNCLWYIAILGIMWLCANEWIVLNIISNDSKYCYVSQTIQFSISHLFALSLIVKQFNVDGPGSSGNEEVLHILQSFCIIGA